MNLAVHNPNFYTINEHGERVLRNLELENKEKEFTIEKHWKSENGIDDMNYMYFENFQMFGIFDCIGSDYERYGCIIEKGDVVVDIGANVGMFSRRALEKGASRVISFEPMSITYSCLSENVGKEAECHQIAISEKASSIELIIPDNITKLGSGSTENNLKNRTKARIETCKSLSMKDLWDLKIIPDKIDFLKIDCEGGEAHIIPFLDEQRLENIKKISMEYHESLLGSGYREQLVKRAASRGFKHFTLFHGDGGLVQIHLWK